MKKFIITALFALVSGLTFAQGVVTLNFDSMKISEDKGKTWSEATPVKGQFVIDEAKKTLLMNIANDIQTFTILGQQKSDDKVTTLKCHTTDADKKAVNFIFSQKAKDAIFESQDGMISFNLVVDGKK